MAARVERHALTSSDNRADQRSGTRSAKGAGVENPSRATPAYGRCLKTPQAGASSVILFHLGRGPGDTFLNNNRLALGGRT